MDASGNKRPRLRNSLDIEAEQLDFLRTGFRSEECALIPEAEETEAILSIVLDEAGWEDHSGEDVPPPDFVNHGQHVMPEAMRVDDHERPGDKKGFVNPSRSHESEIIRQYEHEFREILNMAADDARLTILGKTGLPTEEDHSYGMYIDGFKRIVEKHARHADSYRDNYPSYKLVFYVFDESTGYLENAEPIKSKIHEGDHNHGAETTQEQEAARERGTSVQRKSSHR